MSRTRNFRARTTYENKNRVMEAATELNGAEPSGFHDAIEIVVRYLDVLYDDITACPECGERLEKKSPGNWYCWLCHEERDSGYYNLWDILDSDDPENATVPGLPKHIKLEFECDCDTEEAGMKSTESRQDSTTGTSTITQHGQHHQDTPFDW